MDLHTPFSRWNDPFVTRETLNRALDDVVTAEGIQASSRDSFKGAIFGRDSLEVGLDVVDELPHLARRILFSVVRHIGLVDEPSSEEEPGKGFHEHRVRIAGGELLPETQQKLLTKLAEMWGGTTHGFTYFGAADTGALFLDLLARYVRATGPDILDTHFIHARSGEQMSMRTAVQMSADWYVHKVQSSDLGLVEFQRSNPAGHWYQVMRDGHDGMVDDSGVQANPNAPIAAIEIQAVAHSGLTAAVELFGSAAPATWKATADALRDATIEHLWLEDEGYFARAVFRDAGDGKPVVLKSIDSAAGELLRSSFFDGLSSHDSQRYISGVVERLFSDEFITPIGPRVLSRRHAHLFDYLSYQGTNVVWPAITKRIADGLHRQGFPELGADFDGRIIGACEGFGDFPEYLFVDDDGTPVFRTARGGRRLVSGTRPMTVQAWTASGAFGAFTRPPGGVSEGWRRQLTAEICERLWAPHTVEIDFEAGQKAERAFYEAKGNGLPSIGAGWAEDH